MIAIVVTIAGLVILFAFEIRHREIVERLNILEDAARKCDQNTLKIKEELKKKKNTYEEFNPPPRL
jgi:hypothetical protein